jgi:hypothetical protein
MITYHRGEGFGASLHTGLLLTHDVNFAGSFSANPTARPSFGAIVTKSLLSEEKSSDIVTPQSDLTERFEFGYFEDVHVPSPETEARRMRRPRESVSLNTTWNSGVSDRGPEISYSKPIEGIYEIGGRTGGLGGTWGYLGQVRLQTIEENTDTVHARALLVGSLAPPILRLAPNLIATGRFDTNVFAGNAYGWVRGIAGVVYRPIRQLALGGGGYLSSESGHSFYIVDQLASTRGFVFRGDLDLGPMKVSYLSKWDPSFGWFDREYSVSQVTGFLEAFLVSRQHPNEYNIGFRIRLDDFYSVLRRRNLNNPATTIVISDENHAK